MANLTSRLIISLVDRVSGPARAMKGALNGLYGVAGRRGGIGGIGTALAAQAAIMRRHAAGTLALSGGLGLVGRSGFEAAYGLEKMMNKVQAVGRLTDEQRDSLAKYAQELNKDYPFTNQEIAGAAFELFRAGFSYDQARGALKDTLDMALAGDISRQEAADIATNVLTAMRLPIQTTEQAANSAKLASDVLAYAATRSNTDIRLLGQTFKYVAPLAASAGMSIHDVAAAAMTMANNGIKGSEAGIAMRSALVRMAKPTKDMLATLGRLNINVQDFITGSKPVTGDDIISSLLTSGIDASGQKKAIETMLADKVLAFKPQQLVANLVDLIAKESEGAADKSVLADVISDTLTASGSKYDLLGFVEEMRNKGVGLAEISRIMDIRQGARVLTMLLDDLRAKSHQVEQESEGAARRMADTMQKGIVGQVARLKAAWENLFVSIGKAGVLDTIGDAMDRVAKALTSLSETNPALLQFGTYAGLALAVVGPLGLVLGGVVSALRLMGAALKVPVLFLGLLARRMAAIGKLGAAGGATGAGLAALFGGGAAGAIASTKAGRALAAGMSTAGQAAANNAIGARMIAGMSAAGAGVVAGGSKLGMLAKLGKLGAKGFGRLFWPLTIGLMAWDAWEGYQKTGTAQGAALNALTMGLYAGSEAKAEEATPPAGNVGRFAAPALAGATPTTGSAEGDIAAAGSKAQVVTAQVQSSVAEIRSIIASVDLSAEGQRIMESLAAGIRAGAGSVRAAAQEAGAAQIRNAVRGAYSDGGR